MSFPYKLNLQIISLNKNRVIFKTSFFYNKRPFIYLDKLSFIKIKYLKLFTFDIYIIFIATFYYIINI